MKKILTVAALVLSFTITGVAQTNTAREYVTFDSESITVAAVAIGFTASKIVPVGGSYRARLAVFVVECATTSPCPVRILTTGVAPTTTVGYLLNQGDTVKIYGYDDIAHFQAIRTGANSALIQPLYSR